MQLLKNKEKINMPSSDQAGSSLNGSGTESKSGAPLTQPDSLNVRRDLIALRVKHGADTPIGRRCSNIVELLDTMAPVSLIQRQMAELKRLLGT